MLTEPTAMSDENPKTLPERIDACVAKHAPKAHAYCQAHGRWPHPGSFAADGSAIPPATSVAARLTRLLADGGDETTTAKLAAQTDDQHRRCPYVIQTLPDNRRRLTITSEDGDVVTGVGANIAEAVAAVEAKLS
jgi:hypothetical protein